MSVPSYGPSGLTSPPSLSTSVERVSRSFSAFVQDMVGYMS
jgi:hypothetical protein